MSVVVVVSRLIDPAVGYLLLRTRGFCDDARNSLTVCTEGGICKIYWRLYSVTSSRIIRTYFTTPWRSSANSPTRPRPRYHVIGQNEYGTCRGKMPVKN